MRDEHKSREQLLAELLHLRKLLAQMEQDREELKQSEKAWKQAEGQISFILDRLPALIWRKDREGKYRQVNRVFCDTVGLPAENILGRTDYDLFPPEIAEHYVSSDLEILASGASDPTSVEPHQKPSGKRGISRTYKMVYYDIDGHIAGTLGFALDITRHNEVEAALQERERLYDLLVGSLNDGFFATNSQGVLTFANEALARIHGFDTPGELLGHRFLDFIEPSSRERVARLFSDAVAGAWTPASIEVPILRKNGEIAQAEVKPTMLLRRDAPFTAHGLLIDITQRKIAEEALRNSEEKFRSIFNNAPIGIFRSTVDGRLLDVNRELSRMLGYPSPEEAIAETNRTSVAETLYADPEDRPKLVVEKALAGKGAWDEAEVRLRRKDGKTIPVRLFFSRNSKFSGRRLHHRGFCRGYQRAPEGRTRAAGIGDQVPDCRRQHL